MRAMSSTVGLPPDGMVFTDRAKRASSTPDHPPQEDEQHRVDVASPLPRVPEMSVPTLGLPLGASSVRQRPSTTLRHSAYDQTGGIKAMKTLPSHRSPAEVPEGAGAAVGADCDLLDQADTQQREVGAAWHQCHRAVRPSS